MLIPKDLLLEQVLNCLRKFSAITLLFLDGSRLRNLSDSICSLLFLLLKKDFGPFSSSGLALGPKGLPLSNQARVLVSSMLESTNLLAGVPAPVMNILQLQVQSRDSHCTFPTVLLPQPLAFQGLEMFVDVLAKGSQHKDHISNLFELVAELQ